MKKLTTKDLKLNKVYIFGSDPEIFARDKRGNILPAFTFLPNKNTPIQGHPLPSGFTASIYNDGFQAELRAQPHGCIAYVIDSIMSGLKGIAKKSDGKIVLDNAPDISRKTMKETPDEHAILGCDPSANAYYMGGKMVADPRKLYHRFTGMHIHVSGFKLDEDMEQREKFLVPYVKALDKIVGVYTVAALGHLESKVRRMYYGLAGEYRLPPHGLEYRVLSSACLTHPGVTNLIFEMARGVLSLVDNDLMKYWVGEDAEVIGVINEGDQKAARKLLKINEDMLKLACCMGRFGVMDRELYQPKFISSTLTMGQQGVETIVKDPEDLAKNWKFEGHWTGHCDGEGESWTSLTRQQ